MMWYHTIIAAISGTTVMTVFSYLLSALQNKNYREPRNIGILLMRAFPDHPSLCIIIGWLCHYLVGWLFFIAYAAIWSALDLPPTLLNGAITGTLSGIPAVMIWSLVLHMHPAPPAMDRRAFYIQLIPAHTVFGLCGTLVYGLFI